MNLKIMRGAAVALLAGLFSLGAVLPAQAAPALDSGREIKQAAHPNTSDVGPGKPIARVEIWRVVNNYAAAYIVPNLDVFPTDTATVILRNTGTAWEIAAGPGTAFPQGERGGAPDELLDFVDPYTGQNAENSLNSLNVARVNFQNNRVKFQYPGNATVATGNAINITGPQINEPITGGGTFQGPAYEIAVTPLGVSSNGPLDEWGYDRMLAELQRRIDAAGPGGRVAPPQSATFFHLDNADVFQIDWFGGDSIQRVFYVTKPGGGEVVQVETRVYPIENNPAAPRAESAVNLVLHTLTQQTGTVTPGMPTTGLATEDPLLLIFAVAGLTAVLAGLALRQYRKGAQNL